MAASAIAITPVVDWRLAPVTVFSGMRVLAWDESILYGSRGYDLFRADFAAVGMQWQKIACFRPPWWRAVSAASRLSFRAMRDGFHALAVLPSGHVVAAVPGAIATLSPGETQFRISHRMLRGTRPLHITATPEGKIFWGEYFDNRNRDEVHIYVSEDRGTSWRVAYTFPARAIRHVHNLAYDEWRQCLWILTGDNAAECRILRASCDFKTVDTVLSGSQQTRAAALVPRRDAVYFSTDTAHEPNFIYRMGGDGKVTELEKLPGSSICGCAVGQAIFFSTMIEPSKVNRTRNVHLYGSLDGVHWRSALRWKKDRWPMKLFQYGNAFLPDGRNATDVLAISTVAVAADDLQTSIWRVIPPKY